MLFYPQNIVIVKFNVQIQEIAWLETPNEPKVCSLHIYIFWKFCKAQID